MRLRLDPELSFTELLHQALESSSINFYALTLGLSRNTQPCLDDVQLVLQLITTKSPKWIEVLERMCVLNLDLVFGVCQQKCMYYPSLISVCHPVNDLPKLNFMQEHLFLLLESNPNPEIAWLGIIELIRHYLGNQMHEKKCELYHRISSTFSRSGSIQNSFELITNAQPASDYPERYLLNKFNAFYNILLLFKDCCKIFRKKLKYLEFIKESHLLIAWIKNCYLLLILSVTASKNSERSIPQLEVVDTLKCLTELERLSELELFAIEANPSIVDFLLSYPLLEARSLEQSQGQLNFQYGLITGQYGDDLPSFLARTTVKLSRSQPGFLRSYIKKISQMPQLSQQMILRIIIVYREMIERLDLVTVFLQPLMQRVMEELSNLGSSREDVFLSHKLRLLMFYSEVIKESYFTKMLEISVAMLRVERYTSYNFNEAFNLLQYLCEQPVLKEKKRHLTRASQLIKQHTNWLISQLISIASSLYEQYPLSQASQEREGKLNMIFNLLLSVWEKNQKNAEAILPQILRKCCIWVREEAEANWQQGIKSSLIVHTLLKVCRGCLATISEAYYCDLSDPVYGMLQLLKSHNCRDFEQELLQILTSVIRFEKSVTGHSCSLIVELGRVIEGNKGSLYSVINVLKVLCESQIASSILFDWPDLCLFLFNLFVKGIEGVNKIYLLSYDKEWEEVLVLFGLYIQVFYQFLEDRPSAFEGVEFCVKKIKGCETQFQLMLLLHQMKPSRNRQFYKFEALRNIKRRTTFKMLFYYYSNRLLRNYSQSLVYQLIDFTKHFRYMSESKAFQNEIIIDWPCLQISPKHSITECFKELKRKGQIDNVDYITYMDNLNQLLP